MRTLILIALFGIFSNLAFSQGGEITEKRNTFNKKGDSFFERNEFEKAVLFYSMAYQKDADDYFSILKKAEAYTKLELHAQAEECYRIIFEKNINVNNAYRLKYAFALLANNKPSEFKKWISLYDKYVQEELSSENYLISSEKRLQLYKDTFIILPPNEKIDYKVKYAGYKMRRRSSPEDNQVNLILSNGDEYHIADQGSDEFKFSFKPAENYKIVIRQENIKAEEIIKNSNLSPAQREQAFLNPPPLDKAEIPLDHGMKYQFASEHSSISNQYKNDLNAKVKNYQDPNVNVIDLTVLAKELPFSEGEVYTIRFERDKSRDESYKKSELSTLYINNQEINVYGQAFFTVLPLKTEANFNVLTDIEELEKKYNPKKYGLIVDDTPVFSGGIEESDDKAHISLTINTKNNTEVKSSNRFTGKEIGIIPGSVYILTLSKPHPSRPDRKIEIVVPLTQGVKYNFTAAENAKSKYKEDLAEFLLGRENVELEDEEVINISVLSKELEVQPGEDLTFTLLPAKSYGQQATDASKTISSLTIDEKIIEIGKDEKYSIKVPFNQGGKMNFQTDLEFVEENFTASSFTLMLDTISFTSEITVDTTGYYEKMASGWLSVSVNTESIEEVMEQDQFTAKDVSIIPGKEYILTVSKTDAETGKKDEIIVPLIRDVKYDFTSNPLAEETYKESLEEFMAGKETFETTEGTRIDIKLLSKELQIDQGDEVSFSLLPVKKLPGVNTSEKDNVKSSLFLDDKVVEFTYIHKYTINMPLSEDGQVNMQTNLEYLEDNFELASLNIEFDTLGFFSEITVDTTGYEASRQEEITDPVFDVVTVNFAVNAHVLQPESKKIILDKVVNQLKADNRLYVTIKGYTDALGDADYNLKLSKRRAESVQEFVKSNGIGDNRIRTFSFGEAKALESGKNWEDLSDAELAKHRKVEIVIYLPE